MRTKMQHRKIGCLFILLCSFFCMAASSSGVRAEEGADSAVLRLLATGDLHGQVTAWNYETDEADLEVGLSKLSTLIQEARAEVGVENTLLLDAGDMLYDYSTTYFYEESPEEIQPILLAMQQLHYDYITIGNHEFDYPWSYLFDQLKLSGMLERALVCNVFWEADGTDVFTPSVLFTKTVTTAAGDTREVKIGIAGATRSGISARRQRYAGLLCSADIYANVKEEAIALRAAGADIVIALIHGGIGALAGSDTSEHPGARLAVLPEIDAVVTSHSHEYFPKNDGTYLYYKTVNEEKGLVEGKPMVGTGSHAAALGLIDLQLAFAEDGTVSITDASAALRNVEKKTEEDSAITELFEPYLARLSESVNNEAYPIAEGLIYTNADVVAEDSALYQLINNAKLRFAYQYITANLPAYQDYPVVAVTVNDLDNREDYVKISETISERDIAAVLAESSSERDNGYIRLLKVTGKQIREWLEYSVSIYATEGTQFQTILPSFTKKHPEVSTLLDESRMSDWSNIFVFDGVEYTVDLSQDARYTVAGKTAITKNNRIQNLTYQGMPITDEQELIVVTDSFQVHYWFMPTAANSIYVENPWINSKAVIMDYLSLLNATYGEIAVEPDYNWSFANTTDYAYAFGTAPLLSDYFETKPWYRTYIKKINGLAYFWCEAAPVQRTLSLLLVSGRTATTGQSVPVRLIYTGMETETEIVERLYMPGVVSGTESDAWKNALSFEGDTLYVPANGTYSLRVTDSLGNRAMDYIKIQNYDPDVLDAPQVNYLTNRRKTLSGTAIPGTTVYCLGVDRILYSTQTAEDGSFSMTLGPQKGLETISVWADDGTRTSEFVTLTIRHTGPNAVAVAEAEAGYYYVKGKADPNNLIYIYKGKTVYIPVGQTEWYKSTESYDASYTIQECEFLSLADGTFVMYVPELVAGDKLFLYAADWRNRVSMRAAHLVE